MKIIFCGLYTILLTVLALASALTTWASDGKIILALEIFVGFTLISGCIFYLLSKQLKFWLAVFIPAVIGEVILVSSDSNTTVMLMLFWLVFLFPSFYFNWMVAKKVIK